MIITGLCSGSNPTVNMTTYDDMVTHMKTTIEISDAVLSEAKEAARREGRTLRSLVEEGLRLALERHEGGGQFRLRNASVGGRGVRAGVEGASWEEILEMAYEGRGS